MVMHWPARAGWPGAAALGALAVALPLAVIVTPRWQQEAQALRAERPPPAPSPVAAPAPPALPELRDVNLRVADLLELALRRGVAVDRSQQQLDTATPPRLRLSQAARGSYADIRAYIADALQADPGLALDHLRLQRRDRAAGALEVELQWVLLVPPEGAR